MMRTKLLGFLLLVSIVETSLLGDSLDLSGSPAVITINTATAGSQPNNATNNATTYGVTTTIVARKIVGSINSNMPANVTLAVSLAAPLGAASAGFVTMNTTAQDLVTSINILTITSGLTVNYRLSATVQAAQVTNGTRTLTITLL